MLSRNDTTEKRQDQVWEKGDPANGQVLIRVIDRDILMADVAPLADFPRFVWEITRIQTATRPARATRVETVM